MSSSSEKKPSSSSSFPSVLKVFGFPLSATSSDDGDGDVQSKKIECPYCHREFQNLQALGGHQNAHRRERQMARFAQFEYMRLNQRNQMFQSVVVAQLGAAPTTTPVSGGATRFRTALPESSQLPVAEPPGTVTPVVDQVPVVGVDDNMDLELRLGNSSKESGM